MIRRIPIICRVPIVSKGEVYQTIASFSPNYENAHVMGTYPNIETARYHYQDDMDNWRREHGQGSVHYAIRQTTLS